MEKRLKLAFINIMEQRFCPIVISYEKSDYPTVIIY